MNEKLNNLMAEYASEISKINVSAKDLIEKKIPTQTLKNEIYLRQIYGDGFCSKSKIEAGSLGSKIVKGISANDINQGNEIKKLIDMIDSSEFNQKLETLLR